MKKFQLPQLEVEEQVVQRVSLLDLDNVLLFLFLRNHGLDLSLLRLPSIAGKAFLFFSSLSTQFLASHFSVDLLLIAPPKFQEDLE